MFHKGLLFLRREKARWKTDINFYAFIRKWNGRAVTGYQAHLIGKHQPLYRSEFGKARLIIDAGMSWVFGIFSRHPYQKGIWVDPIGLGIGRAFDELEFVKALISLGYDLRVVGEKVRRREARKLFDLFDKMHLIKITRSVGEVGKPRKACLLMI